MNRLLFPLIGAAVLMIGCAHSNAQGVRESSLATSPAASQVLLDEELVADFRERVDDYMKLHQKFHKHIRRDDIGETQIAQQALAMRIRFARHDARPGDLFRLPIAIALRRALNTELRGLAALSTRESIRDDAPATFVLAVNADYPAGAPRSSMPVKVLNILPPLPSGLQYLIVGTHLLLMDIEANIILDYILDVMCKTC